MTEAAAISREIAPTPGPQRGSALVRRRSWFGADLALGLLTRACAVIVLLMLISLVFVLAKAATPAIRAFGWQFLVSSDWQPNEREVPKRGADGKIIYRDDEMVTEIIHPSFGALPVIYGTAVSSALALVLAVPLSLGSALFLVRIAPKWLVSPVSFLVEFLAAIPSIAYGFWGIFVLVPFLQKFENWAMHALDGVWGFHWMLYDRSGQPLSPSGRDMLCAGVVLAIMILPIITAISRDVLKSVPRAQIEGTLALGATWWQSAAEMLRYSRSGLFGAVMLGLARAAGETMAVTMVIGNNEQIQFSPFAAAQTMSSLLASKFAEADTPIHCSALVEVALILLVMSLAFNIVARLLVVGGSSRTAAAH
jgi:phosphate transport system permease protein